MIYESLVVGGLMAFGLFSDKALGDPMLRRPLVMGALVGLLLGDLRQGLIMGAAIEVVFLGTSQIGGSLPSDTMTGSIFGTAFAILTNQNVEIALTLAIPISMLAVAINQACLFVVGLFLDRFNSLVDKGEYKKFATLHWALCLAQCAVYFIVGFVGISLGTTAIQHLLDVIPQVIMDGLTLTGQILPALGIALLLNMLWDSKIAVFALLGFVLNAYLGMPLMGIACIGIVVAVVVGLRDKELVEMSNNNTTSTSTTNGDDFFD